MPRAPPSLGLRAWAWGSAPGHWLARRTGMDIGGPHVGAFAPAKRPEGERSMTRQALTRFRTQISLALLAGAAAIATIAIMASSGSAQTAPSSLHFVGKSQNKVGFFPKKRPHQGDRFGFGDKVSGDDTGIDRGVCTVIGKQTLCTIQARLSKGTLSLQAFVPERAHNAPIAITGGTGAYNGARGTALVTNVNSTTTDINVTLLP